MNNFTKGDRVRLNPFSNHLLSLIVDKSWKRAEFDNDNLIISDRMTGIIASVNGCNVTVIWDKPVYRKFPERFDTPYHCIKYNCKPERVFAVNSKCITLVNSDNTNASSLFDDDDALLI